MLKNYLSRIIILMPVLLITMVVSSLETYCDPTATVYIEPPEISGLTVGENFTITVPVADVSDLAGWEFSLYFCSRVINVVDADEGPFLKNVRNTIFVSVNVTNNYNITHGLVRLACALLQSGHGADGSGTLATIDFTVVGVGQTPLHLPQNETKLRDSTPMPPGPQPIPHTTVDGLVEVLGNDIGVTNVKLHKTITNDTNVQTDVTVLNYGDYPATFNVTLYYDENEIQTQTITDLPSENSLNLTFIWNTTPVPKGNYTVKAYAPPIEGEVLIENNLLVGGWIMETIMGDVTGDGQVNILDISLVAMAFGAKLGDPNWSPNADINNDKEINILDISAVAIHFGEVDP